MSAWNLHLPPSLVTALKPTAAPGAAPVPTNPAASPQAPSPATSTSGFPIGAVVLVGGAALLAYLWWRRS